MRKIGMQPEFDYTILGAGAVGSWIGGLLCLSGQKVQLVNRSPDTALAVEKSGLTLDGEAGTKVCHPSARQTKNAEPAKVVMIFTKTHQTKAAVQSTLPLCDSDTVFVTLQNGLGNAQLVQSIVGEVSILEGVTMLPATLVQPGVVRSHGSNPTWLGPFGTTSTEVAKKVHSDLSAAGLDIKLLGDANPAIWQKACFNVAANGVTGLIMGGPGLVKETPGLLDMVHQLVDETVDIASASGAIVDAANVHELIEFACSNHGYHKPSMLQDIENGRITEIESLNGYVVDLAEQLGLDAPLNRLILTLVRGRQASNKFWSGAKFD